MKTNLKKNRVKFHLLFIIISSLHSITSYAQSSNGEWSLERSIQYAREHNLSVQQNVLNERLAKLTYQQSVYSQIPNFNSSLGYGRNWGRSIDPTTNQFTRGSYDYFSGGLTSDVLLFGWFQKRNTIAANKKSWQAAQADNDQLMNDISLNVANGFLRAVLAAEQIKVNEKQLELSKAQLTQTQKFAQAGRVPELNVAQLQSQLSTDSSNYFTAIANYNTAILDIKALLNLDFVDPFQPSLPAMNVTAQPNELLLSPEQIFESAVANQWSVKSNELKTEAAKKNISAAKGNLYPQIGLSAQAGSNWASTLREASQVKITGVEATPAFTTDGTNVYTVYQPKYDIAYKDVPFNKQVDNNFRQTLSLNLNVPLFNAWQAQAAVRRARIDYERQLLQSDQTKLDLRNNVYKAHNDMVTAYQKYKAAVNAVDAAQRAFTMAQKRYELGLTNSVEYLTTQNTQYQAESQLQSAKYDYLFRIKVIEYYLGKELKL